MPTLREEIKNLEDRKDTANLTVLREAMEEVKQRHEVLKKISENVLLTCNGNIDLVKEAVNRIHNHK